MKTLKKIFENNREWADEIRAREPNFFRALARKQSPQYLWIGCSDSRAPETQLAGLSPGDMFVHRNIANLVVHTDLNCLSVMQYAVDVLRVRHIIVCGHYGCGGVKAALEGASYGLIDNWLRHVQDVAAKHSAALDAAADAAARVKLLCELNVVEQVANVCRTTIVQDAWERRQKLAVHGWIYGLDDGLLRDLDVCVTGPKDFAAAQRAKGI